MWVQIGLKFTILLSVEIIDIVYIDMGDHYFYEHILVKFITIDTSALLTGIPSLSIFIIKSFKV